MKRLHPPLGRFFDPAVEAFADLMMEQPVRAAEELKLKVEAGNRTRQASAATVTLPDGSVLAGYAIKRSSNTAQQELMWAMLATDVGAPSVPYIYFQDCGLMFSPSPFNKATDYWNFTKDRPVRKRQAVMRQVPALTLGAIEPFARWVNKFDDYDQNRVYAADDQSIHTAMIDNGLTEGGFLSESAREQITTARHACRFSRRDVDFHYARRAMIKRIKKYPEKRIKEIESRIHQYFPWQEPMAKRTTVRRNYAAPLLGFI